MNFAKTILFTATLLLATALQAREYRVSPADVAVTLKTAQAGDRIVITNGTYRDLQLKWVGQGSEKAPITIVAETAGKVVIEGKSSLRLAGTGLSIEGLNFRNATPPSGSVIEFRCGDLLANHCRLTQCAVDNCNPASRETAYSYILLYGRHNRVDHCSLVGKLNLGVTLIVILNGEESQQNFHQIDHNYFGPRPVYGSNGAETIRVGTSQQAYSSSNTVIEENLFERCNGEVEVVSIKSSDNIIRRNIFLESEGVLALRHGDRNTVEENLFVGHGRRNTGGIRVINAGHRIFNNTLVGIAGSRFFSALALMNAVPNSLPNRYCQVKDVLLRGNTFIDCAHIEIGTGNDEERTLAPEKVVFEENSIANHTLTTPYTALTSIDGITFRNNRVELAEKYEAIGFRTAKIQLPKLPTDAEMHRDKGAAWWSAPVVETGANETVIRVKAGEDLAAVVRQAPAHAVVELCDAGGDYAIEKAVVVDKPLTLRATEGLASRPVIRFRGTKSENMITLADGAELKVSGIAFSGALEANRTLASAGISTAETMIRPYTLEVDDCEFSEFGEGGFFAIRGTKSTFAPTITIRRTLFRNLSGDAIQFAAEREDAGKYNADDMLIEDCAFYRILGLPINIYRGGSDESTAGPYVTVRGCNFEDCCNKERGSVIRIIGAQVLRIERCNFSNSGRGGRSIRLDEATWEDVAIRDCNLWHSGGILSMTGKAVKGGMTEIEPTYKDIEKLDFTQRKDSELDRLGIGILRK